MAGYHTQLFRSRQSSVPDLPRQFRDALRQTEWFEDIPARTWQTEWVVHCKPVGDGAAALKYLAPYIFRVAISNRRILKVANDKVTFCFRRSDTGQWRTCALNALEFIRRFLQHVLPKGFVKVRYYGLFSPGNRQLLAAVRQDLTESTSRITATEATNDPIQTNTKAIQQQADGTLCCPICGCVFRRKRSPIPVHADHLFRMMPITLSDSWRSLRSGTTLAAKSYR